ncbi:MAG: ankyrin repeat domain-containing protein [Gammaproteobacteria bacterium]|nr:ankyrin repeat domain-containing protein [Gammaproteobacteria bacterium]MDE0648955.1 ankyrin repeat domain-containing protein [Gammaproteobacteria bacterium]
MKDGRRSARPRLDVVAALLVLLVATAATPPESPVADAAMRGDLDEVRELLRSGADVNAPQSDGLTALHWAADNGDAAVAGVLIYAGANLAPLTRNDAYTPMHMAARGGHADVIGQLVEAGADPAVATSRTGVTPMHLAAKAGSGEAIRTLAAGGAEVDARDHQWGQTPLIFAAGFNRLVAVNTLVELGADVSLTENVLHMPTRYAVDRAARAARNEVLESFRAQSDNPGLWAPTPQQVQAASEAAWRVQALSPEEIIGKATDQEMTENQLALLQTNALSYHEMVGNQGGLTALLHASRDGFRDVVHALLDAGADVNQVSGGERNSPLLIAAINGHFDLMLELLERGADPRLADLSGATPLFAVINTQYAPKTRYPQQQAFKQQEVTHLDVMEALLEAGADPNVQLDRHLWYLEYNFAQLSVNMWGASPFWRAAHGTDEKAMRLLLQYGADPTTPTRRPPARRRGGYGGGGGDRVDPSGLPPVPTGGPGVFPIHAASGVGYSGGDGAGRAGVSHIHVPNGWMPSVRLLVEELGADVNARDHNGYTPLHFAAARGDNELILYLVEKGADVMAVSRRGQTVVDMANGPVQRIQPFPETIALLEGMGAINNHNCVSC